MKLFLISVSILFLGLACSSPSKFNGLRGPSSDVGGMTITCESRSKPNMMDIQSEYRRLIKEGKTEKEAEALTSEWLADALKANPEIFILKTIPDGFKLLTLELKEGKYHDNSGEFGRSECFSGKKGPIGGARYTIDKTCPLVKGSPLKGGFARFHVNTQKETASVEVFGKKGQKVDSFTDFSCTISDH